MTDPEIADRTYIEPVTPEWVRKVIERERPDALLPTMGGQTALNIAMALTRDGTLAEFGVELIGANERAIQMAEDRAQFAAAMRRIGLATPVGQTVAQSRRRRWMRVAVSGYPAIIRPSFTLGGTGGGIAYNRAEFEEIVERAIELSPVHSTLIERSVLGWKEFELEVMRDGRDNVVIVCSIENIDAMGVHTGDSITVAPAMTLTDREYQRMRDAAIAIIREIGVEAGGCNIQFAVNPADGEMLVIEMNPRVSRSSALGVEGDRVPDRAHRDEAGRRLHAGRAAERHHQDHARLVRAGARLRGGEGAAVCLREVPQGGFPAHDADEIRRRSHGDRPDVQGGLSKGPARTRDGPLRAG